MITRIRSGGVITPEDGRSHRPSAGHMRDISAKSVRGSAKVPSPPQHFVFSKTLCLVALDPPPPPSLFPSGFHPQRSDLDIRCAAYIGSRSGNKDYLIEAWSLVEVLRQGWLDGEGTCQYSLLGVSRYLRLPAGRALLPRAPAARLRLMIVDTYASPPWKEGGRPEAGWVRTGETPARALRQVSGDSLRVCVAEYNGFPA